MRHTLIDMKFAVRQVIIYSKIGYNHPKRLRRLNRERTAFFKLRIACDDYNDKKHFNKFFSL